MRKSQAIPMIVLVAVGLCFNAASAENFAIVSPAAIQRLAGLAGTMEGKYDISVAEKNLDRAPLHIARIHVEGTMPHQGIYDASLKAFAELGMMRDFALAYRLTGDRRYLAQASRFMDAWVSDYQLSFNPIDEGGLDALMLTNDLCGAEFSPQLEQKVKVFLRKMVVGYLQSIATLKRPDSTNWQSLRVKLITMGAFALGDRRLIDAAKQAYEKQIAENVDPDGTVEDFHQRDALHYVTYDLDPLLMAAVAAHTHGMDWFDWKSPTGSSLEAAVAWLVPYAQGVKKHEEFVHSGVPFDKQRMAAGVAGFSKTWDPRESLETLGLAAALDPQFRVVVDKLRKRPGYYVNHWVVLAIWQR
ncbi:MAG TPA: alginate lyase family protein [Terracidiphilus sp.]|nr:alginate lyase family protein [Terracidiphilus sp.]